MRTWAAIAALTLVIDIVVVLAHGPSGSTTHPSTSAPATPAGSSQTGPPATQPGTSPVTYGGADNLVTLDGSARSVETTGVVGLTSLDLRGTSTITATGDVVDAAGHDHGQGTVTGQGSRLTVSSASIALGGRLRIQPGSLLVDTAGTPGTQIALATPATIGADRLTFQPPPPAAGPGTTVTTAPPPVPIPGPVTVMTQTATIGGAGLVDAAAPADLHVTTSEGDFSWAGAGQIATSQGPVRAPYLGVRAQQIDVMLHRGGGTVSVHGTALALGVYANGVPQSRTRATIDVLSTHATTGFLGSHHAFVWTPRNLSATYDMAILGIHPGNAAARRIHLGLQPMPPMFGGEPHALVGGDTSGLEGGTAIDSLIARNGNDKRSIGYDATAPGTQLVLVVQGNFDPITVEVTAY